MGRTLALVGSLVIICLLAFLTISVAVEEGIDFLVVLSVIILALLGFGILGALTTPAAGWLGEGRHPSLDRSSRGAAGARACRA